MEVEGYLVEGISIGGQETCIIFPTLNLAFDIGRCPQRAISQDFLFISHSHMDHIGGLPMYVATRGLYRLKPPTIVVPSYIKATVEDLFEVHRKLDGSELKHNLVAMDVGEEIHVRRDLRVKAFRTNHTIPSQGYIVYSIKQKLKHEYIGLPPDEIKKLKNSGAEITNTITSPEIAFTGDTTADFIADEANDDVFRAKILVMEVEFCLPLLHFMPLMNSSPIIIILKSTFVDSKVSVDHARSYGHTHLSEIINWSEKLQNKAIVLIHFSARYTAEEINDAVSKLPASLASRVHALTAGF